MTRYSTPLKGPYPMKQHSLYRIWSSMKQRCTNPRCPGYKNYGARGIAMCDRWRASFWDFAADMGERPPGTWIERINNDGNYEPANCKWASPKEQIANQRPRSTLHVLTFNGQSKPLYMWAKDLGMTDTALGMRLKIGWTVEQALTTPPRRITGRNLHPHGTAPKFRDTVRGVGVPQ